MCRTTVSILLAFCAQANAQVLAVNRNRDAQVSKLADNLVDKLLDRVSKAWPQDNYDLDDSVLGKPGNLAMSQGTRVNSLPALRTPPASTLHSWPTTQKNAMWSHNIVQPARMRQDVKMKAGEILDAGLGALLGAAATWALSKPPAPEAAGSAVSMPKVTEAEVKEAQANWAAAIKKISKTYLEKGDFVGAATTAAGELYGYGKSNVLFKPSKAADYCPLPNLLSNNAHNVVKLKGNPTTVAVAHQKHSALFGVNNSKPVVDAKGAAVDPGQSTVIESATVDSAQKKEQESKIEAFAEMKSFVDVKHRLNGASVEYYSKSYGEWIPAIIGDVRANACPTLLHADGSVLKLEADPDSVRLAPEQARQNSDSKVNSETLAKFNPSFSAGAMERYLQAANCITEANSERSFGEGSKEAYDEQMKLLHSRSEKLNAQLKIHRPWKIHAEKILNLEKGLGCDTTN
eukprot:gnl/MRDRNA2_/MRDRNA2_35780_c0_seq1.p1 gnl/MRDRNA2_/MRDRNA2_35780_c0~~gnl/MRDRNA2_/MRDRNA2_35780_c0_seq1.p1  ORF type:complete len:460 (+),score=91.76 gnl/MRDRNA2_/MRDRNA2_35780_c0_seq1:79-1458(+)